MWSELAVGSNLALGIDTGGTFTDAVMYDLDGKRLLAKCKALTTWPALEKGISAALDGLPKQLFGQVRLVGLSTTLATNAVVEGIGCPAGLILLGYPDFVADSVAFEPKINVAGSIDLDGREIQPLDLAGLAAAVRQLVERRGVQALAISGYYSVMNPAHELAAAELVRGTATVPVVLGHELSMNLNAVRRATTAVLNSRLLPLIDRLIASVSAVLAQHDVKAPVCVVKGDGSLINAEQARHRPVETILSGPAASMSGAVHLLEAQSGQPLHHAVLVDIGGTTTDVAVLHQGKLHCDARGAVLGGYATHVRALKIRTAGLGGDSYVRIDKGGQVVLGPRRAVPLCRLASEYPQVVDRLKIKRRQRVDPLCPGAEFFLLRSDGKTPHWRNRTQVFEFLQQGLLDREQLAGLLGLKHPSLLNLSGLEDAGYVLRGAVTVTDALHVLGVVRLWDRQASQIGMELLARCAGWDRDELARRVVKKMENSLAEHILVSKLDQDGFGDDRAGRSFGKRLLELSQRTRGVSVKLKLDTPAGFMGAPADVFGPGAAAKLGTQCLLAPHAEVANAIGTVVGHVTGVVKVTISKDARDVYHCHTPVTVRSFPELESARRFAREHARQLALQRALDNGAADPHVHVDAEDHFGEAQTAGGPQQVFIESTVTATAVGRPSMRTSADREQASASGE